MEAGRRRETKRLGHKLDCESTCTGRQKNGPGAYYPGRHCFFAALEFPSPAFIAILSVTPNLHSPERQLIELRIEHANLDALIDHGPPGAAHDELTLQRLKKRRLALRDALERLERSLSPQEPA